MTAWYNKLKSGTTVDKYAQTTVYPVTAQISDVAIWEMPNELCPEWENLSARVTYSFASPMMDECCVRFSDVFSPAFAFYDSPKYSGVLAAAVLSIINDNKLVPIGIHCPELAMLSRTAKIIPPVKTYWRCTFFSKNLGLYENNTWWNDETLHVTTIEVIGSNDDEADSKDNSFHNNHNLYNMCKIIRKQNKSIFNISTIDFSREYNT
jgi:hypothetical protein